ncbi:hypothetical protein NL676_039609 [Syzygium grande]|nr:hypothetical protein NL676_039609 [Syzygium grande]
MKWVRTKIQIPRSNPAIQRKNEAGAGGSGNFPVNRRDLPDSDGSSCAQSWSGLRGVSAAGISAASKRIAIAGCKTKESSMQRPTEEGRK